HERAVCVVVLKEGDKCGGYGNHLLRRHVEEVDLAGQQRLEVSADAGLHAVFEEVAVVIEQRVGLPDGEPVFFVAGEVDDVVRDVRVYSDRLAEVRELLRHGFVDVGVTFDNDVAVLVDDIAAHAAPNERQIIGRKL